MLYIGTRVATLLYVQTNEETIRNEKLKAPTGKRTQTGEGAVPAVWPLFSCNRSWRVIYRVIRIGYGRG